MVDRARCSALFTELTLASSSAAVSPADQPSTSRRSSTARCLGGRCWTAARKASSIVSLATTTASGWASLGAAGSSSRSGYGCNQLTSGSGAGSWATTGAAAGTTCGGRTRRELWARAFRQALVAIRYSHARKLDRPWKLVRLRQARRNVSWTRSSASSKEPSIR